MDSAPVMPTQTQPPTSVPPAHWSLLQKIAFRLTFLYFATFALTWGHTTALEAIPLVGGPLEAAFTAPLKTASLLLAKNWLHLTGASIVAHGTGYGDRAVDWLTTLLIFSIAVVATIVWSFLDRRRPNYTTLFVWLRLLLRLTLACSLLWYASIKIFPIQIETPSLAVLSEPVGNTSPMTLLWTTLGFSQGYERVCGFAELLAGVLLIFRRTALMGALLSLTVIANIVLFNWFFDVAVRLYSTNLLLLTLVLLAPDIRAFYRLFWLHKPAAFDSPWCPPVSPHRQWLVPVLEILFLLSCLYPMRTTSIQFAREQAGQRNPSPLAGQWHVVASTLNGAPRPFLTGDGQPMTDLFLEPSGRTTVRATDDTLWRGGRYNDPPNTLTLMTPTLQHLTYTITQPDPTHPLLTPQPAAAQYPQLTLTRVPIALHYRLFDRGFHWINEWGYQR